jgi:hypothetical protein
MIVLSGGKETAVFNGATQQAATLASWIREEASMWFFAGCFHCVGVSYSLKMPCIRLHLSVLSSVPCVVEVRRGQPYAILFVYMKLFSFLMKYVSRYVFF